jgi:7,8-dihydropterin-6-yl-methyl-4-(beta-D-ribofuranosyl)aminobenzene 5'-phosphate synthase
MADLVELDGLEVTVIIDNELDVMSPPPPETVQNTGTLIDIAMMSRLPPNARGDAETELRMDNICCSAHGLSVLVVGTALSVIVMREWEIDLYVSLCAADWDQRG